VRGEGGARRERRWQSAQERARVAAELIEEAESLTQTGAIATPKDVARDEQPPPLRVAQPVATPASLNVTARLDDEQAAAPAPSDPPPVPVPSAPAQAAESGTPILAPTAAPVPVADDPLYVAAREAT